MGVERKARRLVITEGAGVEAGLEGREKIGKECTMDAKEESSEVAQESHG